MTTTREGGKVMITTNTTGERGWVRVRQLRTGRFQVQVNLRDGAGWVEPTSERNRSGNRFGTAKDAWAVAERRFANLLSATR